MIARPISPKMYGAVVAASGAIRWTGWSRKVRKIEGMVATHWTPGTYWGIAWTVDRAIAEAMVYVDAAKGE